MESLVTTVNALLMTVSGDSRVPPVFTGSKKAHYSYPKMSLIKDRHHVAWLAELPSLKLHPTNSFRLRGMCNERCRAYAGLSHNKAHMSEIADLACREASDSRSNESGCPSGGI